VDTGLEAISTIADHAAVGAFLGALWGLLMAPPEELNYWFAWGTAAGGIYGMIVLFAGAG